MERTRASQPRAASESPQSVQPRRRAFSSNAATCARRRMFSSLSSELFVISLCRAAMQTLFTLASTGSRGGVAASFSSSCDFIALYSVLLPLHLAAVPLRRMCCRILVAPAPLCHGQNLHCTRGLTSSSSVHDGHALPFDAAAVRSAPRLRFR